MALQTPPTTSSKANLPIANPQTPPQPSPKHNDMTKTLQLQTRIATLEAELKHARAEADNARASTQFLLETFARQGGSQKPTPTQPQDALQLSEQKRCRLRARLSTLKAQNARLRAEHRKIKADGSRVDVDALVTALSQLLRGSSTADRTGNVQITRADLVDADLLEFDDLLIDEAPTSPGFSQSTADTDTPDPERYSPRKLVDNFGLPPPNHVRLFVKKPTTDAGADELQGDSSSPTTPVVRGDRLRSVSVSRNDTARLDFEKYRVRDEEPEDDPYPAVLDYGGDGPSSTTKHNATVSAPSTTHDKTTDIHPSTASPPPPTLPHPKAATIPTTPPTCPQSLRISTPFLQQQQPRHMSTPFQHHYHHHHQVPQKPYSPPPPPRLRATYITHRSNPAHPPYAPVLSTHSALSSRPLKNYADLDYDEPSSSPPSYLTTPSPHIDIPTTSPTPHSAKSATSTTTIPAPVMNLQAPLIPLLEADYTDLDTVASGAAVATGSTTAGVLMEAARPGAEIESADAEAKADITDTGVLTDDRAVLDDACIHTQGQERDAMQQCSTGQTRILLLDTGAATPPSAINPAAKTPAAIPTTISASSNAAHNFTHNATLTRPTPTPIPTLDHSDVEKDGNANANVDTKQGTKDAQETPDSSLRTVLPLLAAVGAVRAVRDLRGREAYRWMVEGPEDDIVDADDGGIGGTSTTSSRRTSVNATGGLTTTRRSHSEDDSTSASHSHSPSDSPNPNSTSNDNNSQTSSSSSLEEGEIRD